MVSAVSTSADSSTADLHTALVHSEARGVGAKTTKHEDTKRSGGVVHVAGMKNEKFRFFLIFSHRDC
jgi:hypothetical protein